MLRDPRRPSVVLGVLLLILGTGAAGAQEGAVPTALMARATAAGSVRIIVQLGNLSVVPEGRLAGAAAVAAQRNTIKLAQSSVWGVLSGTRYGVVREFDTIPFVALEASAEALRRLDAMGSAVVRIQEDALHRLRDAQSTPLVGASVAWAAGFDGTGVTIAVLDTGVDRTHPFLAGKVVEEACYSSTMPGVSVTLCPNGQTTQIGPGAGVPCTLSGCDHGTHVAGTAAGNGAGAGQSFSGVARGASIISIQVFSRMTRAIDCGGAPPCVASFTSDEIAALEQVYNLRSAHRIAAVNMSFGSDDAFTSPCDTDPMKAIVDTLNSVEVASVGASGNDGFVNALESPACISSVVSVGATTNSDAIASFSNVASFLSLFAPGVAITSSVPGGGYAVKSGTSMATPHVSGAFAILRQALPAASVADILAALQATGLPITDITGITRPRIRIDVALASLGLTPVSAFVTGLYEDVLQRTPDASGLSGWATFLGANCNPGGFDEIAVAFFDSQEFRLAHPLTLAGLVTTLYQAILGRAPDAGGLAGWVQALRQERATVATQGFIGSQEFRALVPNPRDPAAATAVITRFYTEILGRSPDPSGLAGWVNYVVATGDIDGAAIGFITSAEFEARALTSRDFVTILYLTFLDREPDPGGLDGWEFVLRTQLSDVVENGFVASGEFHARIPQICGT